MKRKTQSLITSIIGFIMWLSIIPVVFLVNENLGVIIPTMFIAGTVAIYFKNDDALALLENYLKRFAP